MLWNVKIELVENINLTTPWFAKAPGKEYPLIAREHLKRKESQSDPLPSPGIPKLAFKNGDFHISQNEETKDFPTSPNHLLLLAKKKLNARLKF